MKDWKTSVNGRAFAASYSGGKDSTLALYQAMQTGRATALISMLRKEDALAGVHGVSSEILRAQAASMGLPLITFTTDWAGYGDALISCLHKVKELGAEVLVTGDIDLPEHNCWYEKITEQAGIGLSVPLWKRSRKDVVAEFLSLGFVSKVVSVDTSRGMEESDLGRILTPDYAAELEERGIDCCGEDGEFHTIVLDGPIFQRPVPVKEGRTFELGKNLCVELEVLS